MADEALGSFAATAVSMVAKRVHSRFRSLRNRNRLPQAEMSIGEGYPNKGGGDIGELTTRSCLFSHTFRSCIGGDILPL